MFTNGYGEWGSFPGRIIPKTQKMLLDAPLLNIQHYKVGIKGKVEQSREKSSAFPNTTGELLLKRQPLGFPPLVADINFIYTYIGRSQINAENYKIRLMLKSYKNPYLNKFGFTVRLN